MIRRAGALTWDVLALAGFARALIALFAAVSTPGVLSHVNAGGVPAWAQTAACLGLTLGAAWSYGTHPVRRAWATVWAVGGGEFGTAALILAGHSLPSLLGTLWVLVPAAIGTTLLVGHNPRLRRRPYLRFAIVADAGLVIVAAVVLAQLPHAGPAAQLGFWAAVALGCASSILALQRRVAC